MQFHFAEVNWSHCQLRFITTLPRRLVELIVKLSRVMNRARQDSITTEIMEIVSGAEALGSKK